MLVAESISWEFDMIHDVTLFALCKLGVIYKGRLAKTRISRPPFPPVVPDKTKESHSNNN